jgi:uncharacterized membrane protein YgdD (TMEM256/DUF423 family)
VSPKEALMDRLAVIIGSILMFLSVGAGAFGAHALEDYFRQYPNLKGTYDTAVQYLTVHGLAFFTLAWASSRWKHKGINWAVFLFIGGIILFSGSLFLLVITRNTWLGAITPFGGVAFLAGWFCLGYAAWRS